jgi:hypothetical protein
VGAFFSLRPKKKSTIEAGESFETGEVGEVRVTGVRVASFEKKNPTIPTSMPKNDTHFHSKFVLLHIFIDRV